LNRIAPNGVQHIRVIQGGIGNCSFLAAMLGTARSNPELIENMIEPGKKPGTVKVTLPGSKPVILDEKNHTKTGTRYQTMHAHGDPIVTLLERARGLSLKTSRFGQSTVDVSTGQGISDALRSLNPGKNTFEMHARYEENPRAIAASKQQGSLKRFLQKTKTAHDSNWNDLIDNIAKPKNTTVYQYEQKSFDAGQQAYIKNMIQDMSRNPKKMVATVIASTPYVATNEKISSDSLNSIQRGDFCQKNLTPALVRRHAYSIDPKNSDLRNNLIALENPHGKKIILTSDVFFKSISVISVAHQDKS
jgi:hypothetical protein